MEQSFSPLSLKAIVDVVTGGSSNDPVPPIGVYRSGPEIERLMLDCNLDFRIGSGSRVPTLLHFMRELAMQPNGSASVIRVVERVCDARDYVAYPHKHRAAVDHLNNMLRPDGYEVVEQGGRWAARASNTSGLVVGQVAAKAAFFDFDTVNLDMQRALHSAEEDPEDAVTAACSMVESICRSILVELGLPLPAKKDIEGLLRAVQEPLGLKPGRADLPNEIAGDIRQVLGGLASAVTGVGALRTHAGDAHGRERKFVRIDARIARLALHAASTVALFLLETWERKFKKTLPHSQ